MLEVPILATARRQIPIHVQTDDDAILNVLWVSSDAVLLHSLCKMFGLLDSVKQAVELKRCHKDRQNRSHNHDNGETAAVQTDVQTDIPGLLMDASLAFQCWMRFWRTGGKRAVTKAPPAKCPRNTSDLSANPAL